MMSFVSLKQNCAGKNTNSLFHSKHERIIPHRNRLREIRRTRLVVPPVKDD